MLKDYETNKPVLETDRLIIRTLSEADVPDLKEWLGRDEIYTYWGRKAGIHDFVRCIWKLLWLNDLQISDVHCEHQI